MEPTSFVPDTALPCAVRASPNHGDRHGRGIDAIVLHYTGMPSAEAALAHLCNPAAEVSSHYVIDEAGVLFQLVPEGRRAWHAGRSYWRGERDMNSVSIGIEIVNAGHDGGLPPFPDAQIATVIALCQDLTRRYDIPADRVLAHSDIAPGRKIDPGERFPWDTLAAAGVGILPGAGPAQGSVVLAQGARGARIAALRSSLSAWGFDATPHDTDDTYGADTRIIIAAFQLRFRRKCANGIADPDTVARLHSLSRRHPKAG